MGKGDKSTRRGKIFSGSYGNVRLQGTAAKSGKSTADTGSPARTASKAVRKKA